MTSFEKIFARIQFVTCTKTQTAMAEALGIKQSGISDAILRKSVPISWYMRLFDTLGVNPHWLRDAVGPIYLRTEAGYMPSNKRRGELPKELAENPLRAGSIAPVYGMKLGKKKKISTTKKPCHMLLAVGEIILPLTYLEKGVIVLMTDTDAAAPTLCKGAYVGVDTRCASPVSGEMYAVGTSHEELVLRRLFWDESRQSFLQRADNDAYPPALLSATECTKRLLGKVRWVLQNI